LLANLELLDMLKGVFDIAVSQLPQAAEPILPHGDIKNL